MSPFVLKVAEKRKISMDLWHDKQYQFFRSHYNFSCHCKQNRNL